MVAADQGACITFAQWISSLDSRWMDCNSIY